MPSFRFENPLCLWLLIPLVIIAFYFFHDRNDERLDFSLRQFLLSFLALALCLLGLSRPQTGERVYSRESSRANIYVAIDISRSMIAQDVLPSRLQFAVSFVRRLLLKMPKVRFSIFPFSMDGYVLLPLTSDPSAVSEMITALSPSLTTAQGTDLSQSL